MRRRTKIGAVVVIVIFSVFFCAPVIYYNPMNHAGHASGYESLSCASINIGISYGYTSLLGNDWGVMLSCGLIHV